jgi:preprotein translocase subunit SecG
MYLPILILIIIVAIALILIVMVQNPKGGGLSSTFGAGGQNIGGVQNTNNFLDRTTWTLAIAMFALILLSNFAIDRGTVNTPDLNNALEGVEAPAPSTNAIPDTTKDSVQ